MPPMKRVVGVITTASLFVLVAASAALAVDYPPEASATHVISGNSGTAFTGGNTNGAMIAIVVLVVAGLVALFVARRRAAHSS
jgi:hypothetical protein